MPKGEVNAGGRDFPIPMAEVYSTNLTADRETGLGGWSDREIHNAMVKGVRPDGRKLFPVMPFEAYAGMASEDMNDLIAYLRTLKPVRKKTPPLKSWVPFYRPVGTFVWFKIFSRFSTPVAKAPATGVERGRYLVERVSICGDCHTPRNSLGIPNRKLYMAGAKGGVLGEDVTNITPDQETGIGGWSREDIAELILTGNKPDGDYVQGLMAEVIEAGYHKMTREDALAIADYLKSIPAIKNKVR